MVFDNNIKADIQFSKWVPTGSATQFMYINKHRERLILQRKQL